MNKKELWGEAVIEHASGINASAFASIQSDLYASVYALSFIVFLLLAYKYIHRAIIPLIHCCFSFSQTIRTQDNLSLVQGRIILFIFSLFHFSMVAFFFIQAYKTDLYYKFGWPMIPFFCAILALVYLSKWAAFAFIGWVIRRTGELTSIASGIRDFFILSAILTLPLSFITLYSWTSAIKPLTIWCISILILCYLLFLLRTFRYFIYVRFSIFFWILYLCSLEIVPLALLYSVLLTV